MTVGASLLDTRQLTILERKQKSTALILTSGQSRASKRKESMGLGGGGGGGARYLVYIFPSLAFSCSNTNNVDVKR